MIVRDLDDGRTILIRQADHADLSAQFAAHWGNADFAPLDPYSSVVSATAHHDSHFRDVESFLPIDMQAGRPHGHRTTPFSTHHLDALQENIAWLDRRDRYAALLVSMHHSGLPQNRYDVIETWRIGEGKSPRSRPMRPEVAATVEKMEATQRTWIREFEQQDSAAAKRVWFNFRLLEIFDLLSLYLCCDGYGDRGLEEARLGPIPLDLGADREVDIRIIPADGGGLRIEPYPFDCRPLKASVAARVVPRLPGRSEAECRAEFWRSPRESLVWTITD